MFDVFIIPILIFLIGICIGIVADSTQHRTMFFVRISTTLFIGLILVCALVYAWVTYDEHMIAFFTDGFAPNNPAARSLMLAVSLVMGGSLGRSISRLMTYRAASDTKRLRTEPFDR